MNLHPDAVDFTYRRHNQFQIDRAQIWAPLCKLREFAISISGPCDDAVSTVYGLAPDDATPEQLRAIADGYVSRRYCGDLPNVEAGWV